jgi:hypothetical protein
MVEAMQRYVVWRVYIDPQYIDNLVEKWSNRYGPKRVIEWMTYRPRQIAWAVREYEQAISGGDVHHDGNEMFVSHVGHARKRMLTVKDDKERLMHTLSKDSVRSLRKIDAAMAAVLSWKARSDAIELGIVRWTVTRRFRSSLSPPRTCGVRVRMCRSRRCGGSRWRLTATRWASWGDGPVTSWGRGIMGS